MQTLKLTSAWRMSWWNPTHSIFLTKRRSASFASRPTWGSVKSLFWPLIGAFPLMSKGSIVLATWSWPHEIWVLLIKQDRTAWGSVSICSGEKGNHLYENSRLFREKAPVRDLRREQRGRRRVIVFETSRTSGKQVFEDLARRWREVVLGMK